MSENNTSREHYYLTAFDAEYTREPKKCHYPNAFYFSALPIAANGKHRYVTCAESITGVQKITRHPETGDYVNYTLLEIDERGASTQTHMRGFNRTLIMVAEPYEEIIRRLAEQLPQRLPTPLEAQMVERMKLGKQVQTQFEKCGSEPEADASNENP